MSACIRKQNDAFLHEVPYMLQKQGLIMSFVENSDIDAPQADLRSWSMLMEHAGDVTETVTIVDW